MTQRLHSPTTERLIRAAGDAVARSAGKNGRLCVVNYHRVLKQADPLLASEPDVATFRWQMALLSRCFNVMPLREALSALDSGTLPPRAVCITFDDGYRSVHDLALPVLKEFGLPATVFVTSGYVGERNMWNDRIVEAVESLPAGQLDLSELGLGTYSLQGLDARKDTLGRLTEASKYLPPQARIGLVQRLEALVGDELSHGLMLTHDMVVNLDREGIEIGAHTVTHPILTSLDDDSARAEIAGGKKQLELMIGKPVRLFAYPNGKVGKDFDQRHVDMVRDAGFDAAFTTAVGAITARGHRFQLPRSRPWDATPLMFGLRLVRWLAQDERHATEINSIDRPGLPAAQQRAMQAHSDGYNKMTKRALLIAFHFPPQAASSGIQRTLSFSKHLGHYGWEPMVLSAHPRAYSVQNPSQLASVPPQLVVRRVFALDTKRHLGVKGRYLEVLALPDRWISWCLAAVPAGLSMIRQHRPEVIWSTFPIATAHLIGLALHRLTGLPWVADFRDPMLQSSYPSSRIQRKVYGWIERQAITRCQMAVFTTHSAMASYRTRFPELSPAKFHVIENGYDEDGFDAGAAPGAACAPAAGRRLTLLHSGVLYQNGRDPSPFLEAVAQLKQQGKVDAQQLRVVLRAPGDVHDIEARARQYSVADIVEVLPPIPYREALTEMLAADGLMVFQGTPFNTQIPAKIYEYFRARKPIFGLVDPAGETATVLRAAGFHALADVSSADAIAPALHAFIESITAGEAKIADEGLIVSSSRRHRASELAAVFKMAVSAPDCRKVQ